MSQKRIVIQWIGHSDLRSMALSLPKAQKEKILKALKGPTPVDGDLGPIKTLITNEPFDEIHLLSNYQATWNKQFREWLGIECNLTKVDLKNPSDYTGIYQIADQKLSSLRKRKDWRDCELCMHLSPGTPAMTSIWILLGSTQYPGTFWETHNGKSYTTELPFSLTLDVISDFIDDVKARVEHLIADSPGLTQGFEDIIGASRAIRSAVGRARRAAIHDVSVLILGESGTGKEMFANAIQKASTRSCKPFVAVNCAAFSQSLLESELFGHVANAFTGATKDHKGAFEQAHGGTLFLDEIGECDPDMQSKLLRTLQPITSEGPSIRKIRRVGDTKEKTVDVRIVAATNRDPYEAIKQGRFREDLLHRVAQVTIRLPPLRERKSDIPLIAERLLDQINRQFENSPGYIHKSLSGSANNFVKRHPWPGNVRQLYNSLIQAAILSDQDTLSRQDLELALAELPESRTSAVHTLEQNLGDGFVLDDYLNSIRKNYLQRAMEEAHGVKAEAARLLGIANYQTLAGQLDRLEVTGDWD